MCRSDALIVVLVVVQDIDQRSKFSTVERSAARVSTYGDKMMVYTPTMSELRVRLAELHGSGRSVGSFIVMVPGHYYAIQARPRAPSLTGTYRALLPAHRLCFCIVRLGHLRC